MVTTGRPRQDDNEDRRIVNRNLRDRISYCRRRILQDAREVSELFGPHLAVLSFPTAGNPLPFGNPTLESVLRSCLPASDEADAETEAAEEAVARVATMRREAEAMEVLVVAEQARLRAVTEKVKASQERQVREHWWEVDADPLGEAELPEFARALKVLRADVLRRLGELAEARQPSERQ